MKNPFTIKTTAMEILAQAAAEQVARTPPKPVSDTVVGSVVVMLDKSYQTYLQRREALEAEIARSQELLRQTNTVIASLEAALVTASADPALTQEESYIAGAPLVKTVAEDFMAGFTPVEEEVRVLPLGVSVEPSHGFEVGPLK